MAYLSSKEEKDFLKQYNLNAYERPSVATDIVAFSLMDEGERESIRKLKPQSLKVLLIKRNAYPYKGMWALPGGFCIPGEDVYETARRELEEETGVADAFLESMNVYGESGRDPRGWIISNTFLALLDGSKYRLHAGTDAWEAKWFCIDISQNSEILISKGNGKKTEYELALSAGDCRINATITETKNMRNGHESVSYEISNVDGIAFDHAKIVFDAIRILRKRAEHEMELIFDLIPEHFTISQAQNAYECLLNKPLIGPNFRRKMSDLIVETDEMIEGEGFRPARLYKRNLDL